MKLKKIILVLLKTVLPALLGIYLFYYFFASMTDEMLSSFYRALKDSNYFWIIISLLLGVLAYVLRAFRWGLVLEPLGYQIPFKHRYHAVMIGYLVNLTIPRAGEASRSAMLYRSDAVPFSESFGTIISERAIDFLILCSIGLITLFFTYDDFIFIKHEIEVTFSDQKEGFNLAKIIFTYLLLSFVIIGAGILYFSEKWRLKVKQFFSTLVAGMTSIFKIKKAKLYVILTLGIWACYLLMFALPFYSLPETSNIPISGVLLAFCAGAIGITFTNGGIGSYPLLVGLVIALFIQNDYPLNAQAIGNALGMMIWMSQTFIMLLLGLISLYLLPKNHSK